MQGSTELWVMESNRTYGPWRTYKVKTAATLPLMCLDEHWGFNNKRYIFRFGLLLAFLLVKLFYRSLSLSVWGREPINAQRPRAVTSQRVLIPDLDPPPDTVLLGDYVNCSRSLPENRDPINLKVMSSSSAGVV